MMRFSETPENTKFGKKECVKSVFLFLANYILLMLIVSLFIWLNSLRIPGQEFLPYITENYASAIYLASSLLMLCCTIYFYYIFEDRRVLASARSIWLIFMVLDVSLLVCYFFGYFFNIYSRPIALLALLALLLCGRRDAIFLNVIFALGIFSIDNFSNFSAINEYSNAMLVTPLLTFSAGMVGIFVGSKVKTRLRSVCTGFAICLPILVMIACLEYDRGAQIVWPLLYGLEGGVVSAVLFMALLPVFEALFNCITDYRLRELTDHDAPLMRELKQNAFGTFNHSIVVAHLAEACAIALDEDTALARAAAYYHDVGKLRQPEYFTENQTGYNPHNELTPELSVDIIRSHARDGYELIRSKHLPQILADVALQHHGTLPVRYFYAKAMKISDGDVKIEEYSYSGPKPQSKIAAIIMIADASEAISRSLSDRSHQKVEKAVREIIEERMDLGQFDECDITMRDLSVIRVAIVNCLSGVYHGRIQYPQLKLQRKKEGETKEND